MTALVTSERSRDSINATTHLKDVSPVLAFIVQSLIEHFHYFNEIVSLVENKLAVPLRWVS